MQGQLRPGGFPQQAYMLALRNQSDGRADPWHAPRLDRSEKTKDRRIRTRSGDKKEGDSCILAS